MSCDQLLAAAVTLDTIPRKSLWIDFCVYLSPNLTGAYGAAGSEFGILPPTIHPPIALQGLYLTVNRRLLPSPIHIDTAQIPLDVAGDVVI
jgi:hypothetical protein